VELIVPLCAPWGEFQEATIIIRENVVVAVGRTAGGFDERVIDSPEALEPLIRPYLELYDYLGAEIGRVLSLDYPPGERGDVFTWLRNHVSFIDAANGRWGRLADKLGPFSVRKPVKKVYMPYSGHALTLTYVAYPFEDAIVAAENKGKVMAIGSVAVEWGGVRVASAGIRTIAGALLLAQAAPELSNELGELKNVLERFVEKFRSISPCQ